MEKLLHWSIEAAKDPEKAGQPDPELLSKLFSGYDDHTAMKVNLQEAVESKDKQKRVEALEVFEELVENVDNANDIGNLWAPLLYLCQDPDDEIKQLSLSCVAYAVQNNAKAQGDLLATKQGLPIIMLHCEDKNELTASKALFATSAAIGHNPEAYDVFAENGGLDILRRLVSALPSDGNYNKRDLRTFSLLYAVVNLDPRRPTKKELGPLLTQIKTLKPDSQGKLVSIFDLLRT